jgi:hypothetical protein
MSGSSKRKRRASLPGLTQAQADVFTAIPGSHPVILVRAGHELHWHECASWSHSADMLRDLLRLIHVEAPEALASAWAALPSSEPGSHGTRAANALTFARFKCSRQSKKGFSEQVGKERRADPESVRKQLQRASDKYENDQRFRADVDALIAWRRELLRARKRRD